LISSPLNIFDRKAGILGIKYCYDYIPFGKNKKMKAYQGNVQSNYGNKIFEDWKHFLKMAQCHKNHETSE
jgi:hypothetical protein